MPTPIMEYYRKGWNDAVALLDIMSKDDAYDEWDAMINELKHRFKDLKEE